MHRLFVCKNLVLVIQIRKVLQACLLPCLLWFLCRHGAREVPDDNVIPDFFFRLFRYQVLRLLNTR